MTDSSTSLRDHVAVPGSLGAHLALLVLVNLAYRVVLVMAGFNTGEYTDGILQLTVFQNKAGLYPPLFGALANLLALSGIDLETAGRMVSAISGALVVVPVYLMTRRAFGPGAALYAGLWYTISPLPARWSLHAMTDMLFLLLCTMALSAAMVAWAASTADRRHRAKSDWALVASSVFGALATLTRYQGIGIALVVGIAAIRYVAVFRSLPLRFTASLVAWLAVPAWMMHHGFVHSAQFADRTTGEWVSTVLAYVNLVESFVLISPYYFAYPISVLALVGLFRATPISPWGRAFAWTWGIWAVVIILLQGAFGSFQYRYMMPVLPAIIVLAGAGSEAAETAAGRAGRRHLWSVAFIASVLYVSIFTMLVLVFQRHALGDQKRAATYIGITTPTDRPVFSNERYGDFFAFGCPKMTFWAGRTVTPVWEYLPPRPGLPPGKYLPDGAIVVLSDMYGGETAMDALTAELNFFYKMRMFGESFVSTLYPLMDDIMMHPMFNQNPMAWVMRYSPQFFSTHLYVVDRRRTPEELNELIRRQVPPPGTATIRGSDGRLTVAGQGITTTGGDPDNVAP